MAGNKGAVAIRMDYAHTRICLITAHLAAGFANYEERNRDFRTINHGLRFQRNRSIEDHDTIIWLGDFNYRIGLSDEKVRRLIHAGDLETLYSNDQVSDLKAQHTIEANAASAKPSNGGRSYISILLGSQDHFLADVQIQQRHRRIRYFGKSAYSRVV